MANLSKTDKPKLIQHSQKEYAPLLFDKQTEKEPIDNGHYISEPFHGTALLRRMPQA
jgi:hypothetical protein